MRAAALLLLLPSLALAAADPSPDVDKAARLVNERRYADALRLLDAAWKTPDNGRTDVLRILELTGTAAAALGQDAKAREAFQKLVSLEPAFELGAKTPPKAAAAFAAAKAWQATNGSLVFKAEDAALDDKGRVVQVATKTKGDKLKLARGARFHVRQDGGLWLEVSGELQGNYAATTTQAAGVEWWAELLGEYDRVLAQVGSEKEPVREGAAKTARPVAAAKPEASPSPDEEPTEPAPVRSPSVEPRTRVGAEAPMETVSGEAHGSALRPVGYALAGAGVAALAAGITFGALAKGARDSLVNLKPGDNGLISSISQREAFATDARARTQALVANVMFGLAGALVVSGGLCWFLGGDGGDGAVALAPVGTGFVAAGSF
ncbi:MAG: hypothetical protein K1X89_06365 [Myxococcaceae bacterium]|nr:hypothetical protein [Myxococcaceae bacterium]